MNVFEFSECPIYVGQVLVFASSVRINFTNALSPNYVVTSPNALNAVAENGMKVEFDISFYPLFSDPFYGSITNRTPVNINFGNAIFEGGNLDSFSLQGQYGQPVQGQAKITFYDEFDGTFNPIHFIRSAGNIVNNQDWIIAHTSLSQLTNSFNVTAPMSFSYRYNSVFNPIYRIGDYHCLGVRMDKRTISASVQGERVDNFVTTLGNQGTISVSLFDICGNALDAIRTQYADETTTQALAAYNNVAYTCQGYIENLDVEVTPNEVIKGTVQVTQYL
jgi:hypothetical protein